MQKLLARHKQRTSGRLKLLYEKRSKFLKHALNSMVRAIMRKLKEKSVSELRIGYPKDIARKLGNKLTVNFWDYLYTIKRFKEVGEELGIKVVEVDEKGSSKECFLAGKPTKVGVSRGVCTSVPAQGS